MILIDTGPLVGLFDPADNDHPRCVRVLQSIKEPLVTTVPVLTEAIHLLTPGSHGSKRLCQYIEKVGMSLWYFNDESLARAFDLMGQYADHPMDLADASLVCAAEYLNITTIFTIDRNDFSSYRIRKGHKLLPFHLLGAES